MDVYPMSKLFCPWTGKEQDGNKCANCPYYKRHDALADRIVVRCGYDERLVDNKPPAYEKAAYG